MVENRFYVFLVLVAQSTVDISVGEDIWNNTRIRSAQEKATSQRLTEKFENLIWFSVRAKRGLASIESFNKGVNILEQYNTRNKQVQVHTLSSNKKNYILNHKPKTEKKQRDYAEKTKLIDKKSNISSKHGNTSQQNITWGTGKKNEGQNGNKMRNFRSGHLGDDNKTKTNQMYKSVAEEDNDTKRKDKAILGGEEEELAEFWPKKSFDDSLSKRNEILGQKSDQNNNLSHSLNNNETMMNWE